MLELRDTLENDLIFCKLEANDILFMSNRKEELNNSDKNCKHSETKEKKTLLVFLLKSPKKVFLRQILLFLNF